MTALDTFIQVINAGITIITTMDGQELNRTDVPLRISSTRS